MKKTIAGLAAAATCCCAFALFACGEDAPSTQPKTPTKLRDGDAITLTVGDSKQKDLTEYISLNGSGEAYSVESSAPAVATATLNSSVATVSGVSRGMASVTASAGDVSVSFAVTVYGKAATFDNGEIEYDLRSDASGTLTLAPKAGSGEDTYSYTYTLAATDANASITGNTLTVNYAEPTEKTLTVNVSYTDSALSGAAARKASFTVSVNVTDTRPTVKAAEVNKEVNAATLSESTYTVDLSENIANTASLPLTYSVKVGDGEVQQLDGSTLELSVPDTIPEAGTDVSVAVTASYGTGANEKVTYTYNVKFIDLSAYLIANGSFDNDFEGWTRSADDFGAISEESTYWAQNLPMHNDGKYFKSSGAGTLTSPLFTVSGIKKISFKLGSGGKDGCYVALEKENGDVVAIWRNYKFADTGAEDADKVGTEKFIENFVTYVADLTSLNGERVRIVIHDDEATDSGFGVIYFDSLVTYYAEDADLPTADKQGGRPVFDAQNELADKTALNTLIAACAEITEQGDYTKASYDDFTAKLAAAQTVVANIAAKQTAVDAAKTALDTAKAALTLRVPTEVEDAEKTFKIMAGENRVIAVADYVDDDDLSSITYEVVSVDTAKLTATKVAESDSWTLAVPAEVVGSFPVTVTITVKYKGETALTVTITVTATNQAAATLKSEGGIDESIDLYDSKVTDKEKTTLDFAKNVDNPKNLPLTYSVKIGEGEAQTLEGSTYEYTFGQYTEEATTVTFKVTIEFTVDSEQQSIAYDYVLHLTDTRVYRIKNGGFDNGPDGLEDWTLSNSALGAVNNATEYWDVKAKFNNDGNFFNAYTTLDNGVAMSGNEGAKGTLTSSPFKLGGSGWITYKLGGAKNADRVYLDVVNSETGEVLDRFHNNAWSEETGGQKTGCSMTLYKADLTAHKGKTVYIRITDNSERDYGLFFADSFETYYTAEPQNTEKVTYVQAESKASLKYSVANAGFELGNLDGWTMTGRIGDVSNATGYWGDAATSRLELFYQKDGNWFFEGRENKVAADGEGDWKTGTLTSGEFVLGGSGWITFYLGAAKTASEQYIEIVDADTNTVVARYSNALFQDNGNYNDPKNNAGAGQNFVSALTLIKYKADLSAHVGKRLYIRVVDKHVGGDFGMILVDNFVTYYESADSIGAEYNKVENSIVNEQ